MASLFLLPNRAVTITVAASDKLATFSLGQYRVDQVVGYPSRPQIKSNLFWNSGANTTSAFSAATTVTITAGDQPVYYMTGTGPVVTERLSLFGVQQDPGTLNGALILGGIVTSSTAAAVTATLDTGAVMDAVIDLAINDSFDWVVINTGGANAFTVTAAASGHTLVGAGAVAANTSGRFRTRRTAASTWVTYRV